MARFSIFLQFFRSAQYPDMCLPFDSISVQCVCHACHLASVCQFFYLFPFDSITQTMYERCFILSTLFLVRVIMIIYIERYPSSCVCVHCVCVSVCLCSVQTVLCTFFFCRKNLMCALSILPIFRNSLRQWEE